MCPVVVVQVSSAPSEQKHLTPPHGGNINQHQQFDRHKQLLMQFLFASAGFAMLPDR